MKTQPAKLTFGSIRFKGILSHVTGSIAKSLNLISSVGERFIAEQGENLRCR
jgi:hypothetical protein